MRHGAGVVPMVTVDRVQELLDYDADTGVLTWRTDRPHVRAGSVAGCINSYGYVQIMVDGRCYRAHRLAWLLSYGEWPEAQVDHINGIRSDNRLCNLRAATAFENMQNVAVPNRGSASSLRGVTLHSNGKSWEARIQAHGKKTRLGTFATKEEAQAAYLRAKSSLHVECHR